jgi:hypothetical protein
MGVAGSRTLRRTREEENKRTRYQDSQTLDKYTDLCESCYYIRWERVVPSSKTLHPKWFIHHSDYTLYLLLQRFERSYQDGC